MVAYSFKARFEAGIRDGWKTQTIRAGRARHARPGQMMQLFVGMRTKLCRKICADVRCTEVMAVEIRFKASGLIEGIFTDQVPVLDLEAFALRDGFSDLSEMSAFWRASHGKQDVFHGVLIEWAAPREAA